jgi:hypothetical protein
LPCLSRPLDPMNIPDPLTLVRSSMFTK